MSRNTLVTFADKSWAVPLLSHSSALVYSTSQFPIFPGPYVVYGSYLFPTLTIVYRIVSCILISPDPTLILCSQLMYTLPGCASFTDSRYSQLLLFLLHNGCTVPHCHLAITQDLGSGSQDLDDGFSSCAAPTSYRNLGISCVSQILDPRVLRSGSVGTYVRVSERGQR